jgi:prepilin-type processing-associated H-X9-DG protein
MTKFKRSAEVVLLTEVNRNHSTNNFEYHDIWSPSHLPRYPGSCRMLDDARHRGNANVCYLDGHVVGRPFKSITERDFRADFE